MRSAGVALPNVQSDTFIPAGGMDEITPPLQMPDGACRSMQNFEQGIRGGWARIEGFERWAGNIPTTGMRFARMSLRASAPFGLWGGQLIRGVTSGATAMYIGPLSVSLLSTVILLTSGTIELVAAQHTVANVAGTFLDGEDIERVDVSGGVATTIIVDDPPEDLTGVTAADLAAAVQQAEDVYRAGVQTIVLAGYTETRIVGVGAIGSTVYVFAVGRNPSFSPYPQLVVVTPLVVDPTEPQLYVNWQWQQALAPIDIDGTDLIFPAEPDYVDLVEYNFTGATDTNQLYGVTGIGKGFAFDGSSFTEVTTGMTGTDGDKPSRLAVHKDRLFLTFGASLQYSPVGDPTGTWTPVLGAGEIAMGREINAIGTVVGSDQTSALLVGTSKGLAILYGDSESDFRLVWVSREIGVQANSLQMMSTALFMNDYGVTSLAASQSFGNFAMSTISQAVQKFIRRRVRRVTASVLVRAKNQYRVFFDDGTGLYFTFSGSKLSAITPVRFSRVVRRVWTTLDYAGDELILFTSDDQYLYRMDVGRNFDGEAIDAYLFASFNHMKSPRLRKSFRRVNLEIEAPGGYVAFQAGADVDYGGPLAMQSPEIPVTNSDATLWDEFTWDDYVWDTGARQPSTLDVDGTGKNLSLWVRSNDRTVAPFTITGVMTEYLPRRLER